MNKLQYLRVTIVPNVNEDILTLRWEVSDGSAKFHYQVPCSTACVSTIKSVWDYVWEKARAVVEENISREDPHNDL